MLIKEIRKLIADRRYREETGMFFADGVNMVRQAIENNWEIKQVVIVEELVNNDYKREILAKVDPAKILKVDRNAYESLATKELIQGFGAVIAMREGEVGNTLMVVLEGPRNPGNLGTIMRTMLGLGVRELVIIMPAVDIYHPECIRASMGAIFGIRHNFVKNLEDAKAFCQRKGYESICFDKSEGQVLLKSLANTVSKDQKLAIWFGNEGAGLSAEAKVNVREIVAIEASPLIDSFNLAEAVSIGLYTLLKL